MKEDTRTEELLIHEIQALWSIENMLTEAMPLMIKKASHPALKMSLAHHFAETDQHRVALELICKQLDFPHKGSFNEGMKKILDEGEKMMSENVTDEAIISIARQVEHYETESYRSAAHYVEGEGHAAIASRLRLTLEEEQQADGKLSFLLKEVIPNGGERAYRDELVDAETN